MGIRQARIKAGSTPSFPLLERRLKISKNDLPDNIKTCIIEHLEIVSAEYRSHFNDDTLHVPWYGDPFNTEIDPNAEEEEELAEFKASNAMKLAFSNKTDDSSFWLSLRDSYPQLSKKAFVILVQFATTYLCEVGFCDLASIKQNPEIALMYAVTFRLLSPRWSQISKVSSGEYKNTLRTDYVNLK